ncbi:hypothetical protein CXG81DRAFT_2158, partial [Caulochytrium protostelioides]
DHKISGDAGREVWLRTHVPPDQLFLVWGISDTQSCGRLSFQEFSAGRLFDRLAAAMDAAPVSTPTTTAPPGAAPGTAGGSGLATPLTGVGAMAGLPPPASATAAMPRGPISAHTTGDGGVLPNLVILPADRVKYGKLFDKLDADNKGYVPGADAHAFLTRSKLSSMVLGQIWELSDTKKLGSLDRNQFIVLMHLVAERMAGRPLPASQQLAQLRVVFQTAKHDVQDLEEQLTQERQAYEQDQRHLQLAETGVLALQSEKTALQEQLAQNETRAQTLKKSIGEYTDFSVGLKEEVAKLREELRKTLQLVDVAQQQVASAESEYKALKDDVADLTERRENQRKRSEALQSQL